MCAAPKRAEGVPSAICQRTLQPGVDHLQISLGVAVRAALGPRVPRQDVRRLLRGQELRPRSVKSLTPFML